MVDTESKIMTEDPTYDELLEENYELHEGKKKPIGDFYSRLWEINL